MTSCHSLSHPPCCGAGAGSALGDDGEQEEAEADEEDGGEAAHAADAALFGGGLCGVGLGQVGGLLFSPRIGFSAAGCKAGRVGRVARYTAGRVGAGPPAIVLVSDGQLWGAAREEFLIKSNTCMFRTAKKYFVLVETSRFREWHRQFLLALNSARFSAS